MTLCSYFLVFLYRTEVSHVGKENKAKDVCSIGNVYFSLDNLLAGIQFSYLKGD